MKRLFIILSLLVTITGEAQNLKFEPSFAAIIVKNIDSSIAWYSKVLNLSLRNRVDNATRGFKQAILIDKGIMIELVESSKSVSRDSLLNSQTIGTRLMGYNKFGFTVKNIDSVFQLFSKMSVKFHGRMVTDAVNNKKTFLITDPDGNLVQFFEK